ncbi:hypothetical protein ACGC1H_006124 [Rhizoctonia solani]
MLCIALNCLAAQCEHGYYQSNQRTGDGEDRNCTICICLYHIKESRLASISPARAAIYNSAESNDVGRRGCTPGTRNPQIELLLEWTYNPEAGRTCWINGMAGTGKTTIAYSVCTKLDESFELGASFFCSRVIPECRQVKYIIPAISYQLARFSLPFRCALDKILESDPDAHTRELKIQYRKLLVEPLLEVQGCLPEDLIVVIDALDECENENSLGQILDLILSPEFTLPIRFLVSSRPEMEIYRRMMGRVDEQGTARLVLHDLDADTVKSDIESYMRHELQCVPLTDAQWCGLVERCGVLFIYASTACYYIKQGCDMETLDEAVATVMGSNSVSREHEDENMIDELYSTILAAAFDRSKLSQTNRTRMKSVLEAVMCAREPMTLDVLAGLLGFGSAKQVDALLKPLRSVLNVAEVTGLVTTLHASFQDFMFSPYRLESRVDHSISPGLFYACRYWSNHLSLGESRHELVNVVHRFYFSNLLIWMEILNLTQNMRFGTNIIREAEKWCRERAVPKDLARMARDAWEFVSVYANHPVSQSTPHIYVSMLPFWPRSQPISIAYMPRTVATLEPVGTAIVERRPALLATWRVSSYRVESMCLSTDGTRLAANDGKVPFVLDTSTGDRVFTVDSSHTDLVGRVAISPDGTQIAFHGVGRKIHLLSGVTGNITRLSVQNIVLECPIVFSPDGLCVAFGSSINYFVSGPINRIHIHGPQDGEPVLSPLEGHTDVITSIIFSPNGLFLASGSRDQTIRVWDTKTGAMVGDPLKSHTSPISTVAYSPDSARLASGSARGTIRVWDPYTGQLILGPFGEHSGVASLAFSPNAKLIAAAEGTTIQVYNAQTGQTVLGPLEGHTNRVNSVIFSRDNEQLFSCSSDGTIRLWNMQDLAVPYNPQPQPQNDFPNDLYCARYSYDGLHLVSGSTNGTVYIWDVLTGEMTLGPLVGHTRSISAVDLSPNNAYVASASRDTTLRIWDAQDGRNLHGPLEADLWSPTCIRFSPDSLCIIAAAYNEPAQIWDVYSGQLVFKHEGRSTWTIAVAFSPDGSQFVSGLIDGVIKVWDRKTGQIVAGPVQGHRNSVMSVEFSPDGSHILSASWDSSIQIWEVQTGRLHHAYGGSVHNLEVYSVAFSPDGHYVVTGSHDHAVRVWNAQDGHPILALKGHTGLVESIQFSPDGSHVVSCSKDGTIRLWDISSRQANLQFDQEGTRIFHPNHALHLLIRICGNEADNPSSSSDDTTDPWFLDGDGWVVDQKKQRLVWVPVDLRIGLLRHPNDSIICSKGSLILNFDGVNIGEKWEECYRP